jgi:hypothetical protein
MSSQIRVLFGAVLLAPLALLLTGRPTVAESDNDRRQTPDLVITEDSQLALLGKTGKAVIGSCKKEDALWHGKIALKNIGSAPVVVEERGSALPPIGAGERERERERRGEHPHLRAYVPNNIELRTDQWLTRSLGEFGQELLDVEIGVGKDKCRNYEAPPVFDERLSGLPGPIRMERMERGERGDDGPPDPYTWRIKKIQRALNEKGYAVNDDGEYGAQTIKALEAYFKDHHQVPPRDITKKPLPPETVSLLFEALGIPAPDVPPPGHGDTGPAIGGADECRRGVNLVPVYVEIDPERAIPDENRSNNRVQFTVAIDCSTVAK